MIDFTIFDYISFLWYLLCWGGYTIYSDGFGSRQGNLIGVMSYHRKQWMISMLHRDNRMVDLQIVSNLLRNASFFASTAILIVAGLVTLLGATDKAMALLDGIPYTIETSRQAWELKTVILIVIFIYTFFKFAWAMRQLTYCSILIGTAKQAKDIEETDFEIARRAAEIASKSALHANRGTRAYYFGIALLCWFIHPILLIPTSILIITVLHRREFRSQILAALKTVKEKAERP